MTQSVYLFHLLIHFLRNDIRGSSVHSDLPALISFTLVRFSPAVPAHGLSIHLSQHSSHTHTHTHTQVTHTRRHACRLHQSAQNTQFYG